MPNIHVVHQAFQSTAIRFRPQNDYVFSRTNGAVQGSAPRDRSGSSCRDSHRLAGEIQPTFQEYWERDVKPLSTEKTSSMWAGDFQFKNELLSRAGSPVPDSMGRAVRPGDD
jgi:hypothetical protein